MERRVCCIHGCGLVDDVRGLSFHRFPSSARQRKRWQENILVDNNQRLDVSDSALLKLFVCGNHFEDGELQSLNAGRRSLAVPTIFPNSGDFEHILDMRPESPADRPTEAPVLRDGSTFDVKPLLEAEDAFDHNGRPVDAPRLSVKRLARLLPADAAPNSDDPAGGRRESIFNHRGEPLEVVKRLRKPNAPVVDETRLTVEMPSGLDYQKLIDLNDEFPFPMAVEPSVTQRRARQSAPSADRPADADGISPRAMRIIGYHKDTVQLFRDTVRKMKARLVQREKRIAELKARLQSQRTPNAKFERFTAEYGRNRMLRLLLTNRTERSGYNREMREFAVALRWYSRRAYRLVRRTCAFKLPRSRTVAAWMRTDEFRPSGDRRSASEDETDDDEPLTDDAADEQQAERDGMAKCDADDDSLGCLTGDGE